MASVLRASDFIGTLGINTHIDFNNYGYQTLSTVESAIEYLGVQNIRDSSESTTDLTTWLQVSQTTGAKFDDYMPEGSPASMQSALTLAQQLGAEGVLAMIEGGNEEDDAYAASQGNTLAITATFQQQVWAMGQTLGLPVINMSFGAGWTATNGWQGDYGAVGDLSAYTTYGNAHTYPGVGQGTDWSMQRLNGLAELAASTRPVVTSEIGWDLNAGWTEPQVATNVLQAAMDGIKDGDVKTYFYSLFNDGSGAFGLMNQDGTPTWAGTALHDLTTLLTDTGATAKTFTPGTLAYTLSGATANDKTVVIEKSDGSSWLGLWDENDAAHSVTIKLSGTASEMKVFDPIGGTTAVQDVKGASSVTLSVSANPELVEIIGAPGGTSTGGTAGTGGGTNTGDATAASPNDLSITAPASATATAGAALAVTGVSISDAWGATNPGTMVLNLWDANGGTLSIAGHTGSSVSISDTLASLNADLASLQYTPAAGQPSDTITVDVWNQAGVEADKSISVGVTTPAPTPTTITIANTTASSTINNSYATITATAGNHMVFIGGTHDTAILTGGTEKVQALQGYNSITTGAYNDTIAIAGTGNVVNGGNATNSITDSGSSNTIVVPTPWKGMDNVLGNVLANGDKFDFTAALKATKWDGVASHLGSFLHVSSTSGGDAIIRVSVDPRADGGGAVVLRLHGVGQVDFSTILAHGIT